jgi:hypothetical protein
MFSGQSTAEFCSAEFCRVLPGRPDFRPSRPVRDLRQNAPVLQRLTGRKEWQFFAALPKADPSLAAAWWAVLLLRGTLPACRVQKLDHAAKMYS